MAGRLVFHESCIPLLEPIDHVRPHERNANMGDTDAIIKSIQMHGFTAPVLAQRSTGRIVAGNHRYAALVELGADQIPVLWVDLDDDQALRYMLDDNRSTRLGSDDLGLLHSVLTDIREHNESALEHVTLYDDQYYDRLTEVLNDPFGEEDTEDYAKQRSGHVCQCPECGWRADR